MRQRKGTGNTSLQNPYESEQFCGSAMCIMHSKRPPLAIPSAAIDFVRSPHPESPSAVRRQDHDE
jgi:hypothetical protein